MPAPITAIRPPEKAGITRIEIGDTGGDPGPLRRDDVITLPEGATDLRYFPLMDGEQFVAIIGDRAPRIYFGGTDEAPFLVELDRMHMRSLDTGGEAGFYEGLKPKVIRDLETKLGLSHTGRQGDIWFFELGQSWDEVDRQHRAFSGNYFATSSKSTPIFRTRHVLRGGKMVPHPTMLSINGEQLTTRRESVGDGTLTAPDHETAVLEGPHVLGRTPGIMRPHNPWAASARRGRRGD